MPITTATYTRTQAAVGRSTTTAVGTACRTTPKHNLSITTRPPGSRAISALQRLPGAQGVGAVASAVLTAVMVVAVEAASVGSTVVVGDSEVLVGVVVGI